MKKLLLILLTGICVGACLPAKTQPGRVGQMYFATVSFTLNSNEISPHSERVLNQAARIYKKDPSVQVQVRGYTDSIGTQQSNLHLSKVRAGKVAQALLARGVPRDHMTAVGYVSEKPIAYNHTAEGRQQNRRVEIEFPYPEN